MRQLAIEGDPTVGRDIEPLIFLGQMEGLLKAVRAELAGPFIMTWGSQLLPQHKKGFLGKTAEWLLL